MCLVFAVFFVWLIGFFKLLGLFSLFVVFYQKCSLNSYLGKKLLSVGFDQFCVVLGKCFGLVLFGWVFFFSPQAAMFS